MVSRANNIKSHWAGALVAPLEATHAALARPSMHSDPIDPHASIDGRPRRLSKARNRADASQPDPEFTPPILCQARSHRASVAISSRTADRRRGRSIQLHSAPTCGDHSSVVISIRITSRRSQRQSHQRLSHANDGTLPYRAAKADPFRCKRDDGRPVFKPSHLLPLAEDGPAGDFGHSAVLHVQQDVEKM